MIENLMNAVYGTIFWGTLGVIYFYVMRWRDNRDEQKVLSYLKKKEDEQR